MESSVDSNTAIRFTNSKNAQKIIKILETEEDFDTKNFNLGKGSWPEKKARLDKFLFKISSDKKLQ